MKPRDCPFPLEDIPQPLRGMALSLSNRYAAPPGVVVIAMLGCLGAAGRIEFEPWPGHSVPACLNVLFAGQAYQAVVEAVWAPLLSAQRARVKGLVFDAESLDRETARLGRERKDYIERVPCRPADLLHFDERLADLRLARWPVVMLDPVPGSMETAGHTAILYTQAGRAGLAIDHWAGDAGASERELLAAGWHQRADSRTSMKSSVSVSVMMVASPEDANRLLTDPWAVRSGLAGTFLVVRASEPALDESPANGADQWADLVQRLYRWRHAGNTMLCRAAPEARRALDELALELASLARIPEPHRHLGSWHQQALRLTLLLHVGAGDPKVPIAPETVQAALALTRWLIDQRAALLAEPDQPDPLEEFVRGLVPTAGTWLTVTQSYDAFAQRCRGLGIQTPARKDYTGRITDLIDQIHGIRLRKDVPGLNGKNQTGWAGIELAETATEGINDSARLPDLPVLPARQPADQIEFLI